jgi:transposase InsO family protein
MDFDEAVGQLAAWEYRYNHERFSMALNGRTPMEKLAAILAQSDRNHQHGARS